MHLVAQHLCQLHLSTNDTRTHGMAVLVQALSGVFWPIIPVHEPLKSRPQMKARSRVTGNVVMHLVIWKISYYNKDKGILNCLKW